MRVTICGLFQRRTIGDPDLATSIPILAHFHDEPYDYAKKVWDILRRNGVEKHSVVEVVATAAMNDHRAREVYAIVTRRSTKFKSNQLYAVIDGLVNLGLDVEVPQPVDFYPRKK